VKLELDTAHSVAGGGGPAAQILKYRDRLLFLHLKDVVDAPTSAQGGNYPFKFFELGRGRVDLPAVFTALNEIAFAGWAVFELDYVTHKSRTQLESALIIKTYLEQKIRVHV
jgi:inosose dehydratase